MTQAVDIGTQDIDTMQAKKQRVKAVEGEGKDTTDVSGKESLRSEDRIGYMLEEDLDIDDFEIVSPEFFSQVKEPSFTVNVNKVYVNAACVRMLPEVEYVKILVSRRRKQVVFEPSDEMDIEAYRWSRLKDGKRYASQRTGNMFVMMLCKMMGWDPDYRYKIIGRLIHSKGNSLIVFDLMTFNCYPKSISEDSKGGARRRTAFPIEKWNGRFGPTYAESKRSLQVNTFDEYTVWTIKEGETVSSESSHEKQDAGKGGAEA